MYICIQKMQSWWNVNWWTQVKGIFGISLCSHFTFSVTINFVKMFKVEGKKRRNRWVWRIWDEQSWLTVKGCFSGVSPSVFMTEPGTGEAWGTVTYYEAFSHCGFFEFSVLSLCSSLKYWNLLCSVWSFLLWPEASILESLKRKLLVHWQNKWGEMLNCKLRAPLYDKLLEMLRVYFNYVSAF